MIISRDINPKKNIYYLGALLIQILDKNLPEYDLKGGKDRRSQIDFFQAFQEFKTKENISISLFIFIIDWLFLLGIIELNGKFIKRCS